MDYYERSVNYFKFFDDIKLMEIDNDEKRIGIVFMGKENMIHLFDLNPYLLYMPYEIEEDYLVTNLCQEGSLESEKMDILDTDG